MIVLVVVLIVCIGAIVASARSTDKITLTPQERVNAKTSCLKCHDDFDSGKNDFALNDVHWIHANAEFITCHSDVSGLQSADNTNDILQWTGIGIGLMTVAGCALNFALARRRLAGRESDDGKTHD